MSDEMQEILNDFLTESNEMLEVLQRFVRWNPAQTIPICSMKSFVRCTA